MSQRPASIPISDLAAVAELFASPKGRDWADRYRNGAKGAIPDKERSYCWASPKRISPTASLEWSTRPSSATKASPFLRPAARPRRSSRFLSASRFTPTTMPASSSGSSHRMQKFRPSLNTARPMNPRKVPQWALLCDPAGEQQRRLFASQTRRGRQVHGRVHRVRADAHPPHSGHRSAELQSTAIVRRIPRAAWDTPRIALSRSITPARFRVPL